ncbi:MAG: thiamine phosphate synthase [Candidatus Eisenbacteria bacterium]
MRIGRLHVITDGTLQTRFGHVELARLALEGGAETVQYRRKDGTARQMIAEAAEIHALCRRHRARLIVNDRVDIAMAVDADGVHLGVDDLPIGFARELLGATRLIGGSSDNAEEAVSLARQSVDYAGIGPVFATRSKQDTGPVLGLEGLAAAVRATTLPLIAIGGISIENIDQVLATGVHGVAVLGAVCLADDPLLATRTLRERIDRRGTATP